MSTDHRPSKKQRELLTFIDAFIRQHGYGPSYREIMRGLAYKSVSTVAMHIDNLIAKGHLTKRTRSARSLEVTPGSLDNTVPVKGFQSHEDWLAKTVHNRLVTAEKATAKLTKEALDELFVLVGALHVLAPHHAPEAKARLIALQKEEPEQ